MRIGMIGGGGVGQSLGAALQAKGHDVMIGVRDRPCLEQEPAIAEINHALGSDGVS